MICIPSLKLSTWVPNRRTFPSKPEHSLLPLWVLIPKQWRPHVLGSAYSTFPWKICIVERRFPPSPSTITSKEQYGVFEMQTLPEHILEQSLQDPSVPGTPSATGWSVSEAVAEIKALWRSTNEALETAREGLYN